MSNLVEGLLRAGFWRRLAAFLIDLVVVLVPLQIVVAILFAQTNGAVQGSYGLVASGCEQLDQLPEGLPTPPLEGFNLIAECRSSFFGFDTSRSVVISKVNQEGAVTTTVAETYALGADGRPREVLNTNWIALVALLAYLILLESRFGRTVGKRVTRIHVVDSASPRETGIPLRKVIGRYMAIWIGLLPALAVVLFVHTKGGDMQMLATNTTFWVMLCVAGVIELAWIIWIIVSVSRKRDPIYDRIAGTTVTRAK